MKIFTNNSDFSRRVDIDPFDDGKLLITIHKSKQLGTHKWGPANILWASIGSVTPDKAQKFAAALYHAVSVAEELDAGI